MMHLLAVDVGGSHSECALVSGPRIVRSERVSYPPNTSFRDVLRRITGPLSRLEQAQDCAGIAVSFCGLVDPCARRIVSTNAKFDDGRGIDLEGWARAEFGLPLEIDNDARCALLGEWYAGAARGFGDVVMVTLGTGVGGAAMISGRLLRGRHYQAGCLLGHFTLDFQGAPCTCGSIGCVEVEGSTVFLPGNCSRNAKFRDSSLARLPSITYADVFAHAEQGDSCAQEVRDRSIRAWAAATVTYIHAYDPEVVVFGGGVMASGARILSEIEQYVSHHAWTPWGKVAIRAAELGNQAALLAATPLFEALA